MLHTKDVTLFGVSGDAAKTRYQYCKCKYVAISDGTEYDTILSVGYNNDGYGAIYNTASTSANDVKIYLSKCQETNSTQDGTFALSNYFFVKNGYAYTLKNVRKLDMYFARQAQKKPTFFSDGTNKYVIVHNAYSSSTMCYDCVVKLD